MIAVAVVVIHRLSLKIDADLPDHLIDVEMVDDPMGVTKKRLKERQEKMKKTKKNELLNSTIYLAICCTLHPLLLFLIVELLTLN